MHIAFTQASVVIAVFSSSTASNLLDQRDESRDSYFRNYDRDLRDCVDDLRRHLRVQSHRPPPVSLTLATVPLASHPLRSVRVARRRASWTRAFGAVRERRPTRRALRTWERASSSDEDSRLP